MQSFEEKLQGILAADPAAARLFERVIRRGIDRHGLFQMLGEVTDRPALSAKLRKAEKGLNAVLAPSRDQLSKLAKRLERDAATLETSFGTPLMEMHSTSREMLDLSKTLRGKATAIRSFPLPAVRKLFSYRKHWARLPVFLLCVALKAPQVVRFQEVQDLLVYAYEARGERFEFDRSVARRYRRFSKTIQGQFVLSALKSKSKWRVLAARLS
jgi:hypothetical protein